MGLAPGYMVSQHVQLVRALRRGGMGSVWIADHTALKTQVAVKFISGGFSDDPSVLARFNREATAAAQIKSPHVVQVHDHGVTADAIPFIVMELLDGEDLSTHIKRVKRMPVDQVATILLQTCRVLTKAHKLGIIHRDIKPGNIFLVDTEGDIFVKLLDFGIAKTGSEPSEITGTGAMVGTLCYMSPEQLLSSRRVDHRADLWSLAVVAYRALTGELPFKDDDGLGALCRSLESGIFFPPSEYVKDLPHDVDAFFEKAFQREPAARFSSAKEMADEFFLAIGQTLAVMPPSTSRVPLLVSAEPLKEPLPVPEATKADAPSSKSQSRGVAARTSEHTMSAAGAQRSSRVSLEPGVQRISRASLEPGEAAGSASAIVAPPRSDRAAESTAQGQTFAGTASTPPPAPARRSASRRALVTLLTLSALVGGGLAGARYLAPARFGGIVSQLHITGDRPAPPPPPAVASAPATDGPSVTPAPSASDAASASSAQAVAPVPSASAKASASPSASPSASVKVKPRNPKPEKDYGF